METTAYRLSLDDGTGPKLCGYFEMPTVWCNALPRTAVLAPVSEGCVGAVLSFLPPSIFRSLHESAPEWGTWAAIDGALQDRLAMLLSRVSLVKALWVQAIICDVNPSSLRPIVDQLLYATQHAYDECAEQGLADDPILHRLVHQTALHLLALQYSAELCCPTTYWAHTHSLTPWPDTVKKLFADAERIRMEPPSTENVLPWLRRVRALYDRASVDRQSGFEEKAQVNAIRANPRTDRVYLQNCRVEAMRAKEALDRWNEPAWMGYDNAADIGAFPLEVGVSRSIGNRTIQQDMFLLDSLRICKGDTEEVCPLMAVMDGHGPTNGMLDLLYLNIAVDLETNLCALENPSPDRVCQTVAHTILDIEAKWNPPSPATDSGLALSLALIFQGNLFVFGIGDVRSMVVHPDGRMARLLPPHRIDPSDGTDSHFHGSLMKKVFGRGGRVVKCPDQAALRVIGPQGSPNMTGVVGDVWVPGLTSVPLCQIIPLAALSEAHLILSSDGLEGIRPETMAMYLHHENRLNRPLGNIADDLISCSYMELMKQKPTLGRIEVDNATILIVKLPNDLD